MSNLDFQYHLKAAWDRRKAYIEGNKIEAYRLATREELELPVAVDVYGKMAVLQLYEDWVTTEELEAVLASEYGLSGFYKKRRFRVKDQPESGGELNEDAVELIVNESGHKFLANLNNYLDTGLFLDHRETRKMVERMVNDMKKLKKEMSEDEGQITGPMVLNLFAYTGSFSIYAAAGGASMTHTVDLSKTYCDWARRNLDLNGFTPDQHWVYRMDTFEFYRYAARKGLKFDLIIIDPPTFSRNKGENFSVLRDQDDLIFGASELLADGGQILFSNNCLEFKLSYSIKEKFTVTDIQNQTVPLDFWIDTQHPGWWEGANQIHNCYLLKKKLG